jgi:hypothetical protein
MIQYKLSLDEFFTRAHVRIKRATLAVLAITIRTLGTNSTGIALFTSPHPY